MKASSRIAPRGTPGIGIMGSSPDEATLKADERPAARLGDGLWLRVFLSTGSTLHRLPAAGSVVLGRGDAADIVVPDASVSRRHAVISIGPPLMLEDLSSQNGTRHGDKQLVPGEQRAFAAGDILELGTVPAVVQAVGTPCSTAMVSPEPPEDAHGAHAAESSMDRLHRLVDRVAPSVINVLLLGETGVGKERLAETVHRRSGRLQKPFLRINCAALPDSLLESELFGHEKGAFTGASQTRAGLLETADGGTVFLDEIGETSQALQAKLLRAIEHSEIMRVGGRHPVRIDVRFISATNRDLKTEVAQDRFRRDLYFRLAGISLHIPPLRQRPSEIPELARAFLVEFCGGLQRAVPRISDQALEHLQRYDWPGNIRELRNVAHQAALLCDGDLVLPEHLPPELLEASASVASPGSEPSRRLLRPDREQIIDALSRCGGNQTEAAQLLQVSRRTLVYRLKELDIPRPRNKAAPGSPVPKSK
jgi:DNA-binding NtrC family response regulator